MLNFRKRGRYVYFSAGSVDGSGTPEAPDALPTFYVYRKRGATAAVEIAALAATAFELLDTGRYLGTFQLLEEYAAEEAGFEYGDAYVVYGRRLVDDVASEAPLASGIVARADLEDLLTLASLVDGITLEELLTALLAVAAGVSPEGTPTQFMKRDAVTPAVTVTIGAVPGERTASVLPSEE